MDTTETLRRRSVRTLVVVLAVVTATVLGGWRVVASAQGRPDPSSFTIGAVTYRVTHAEAVPGLSDEDLSGMGHGIQGLVSDDKAIIRVSLVLSSGSDSGGYDPGALRLRVAGSPDLVAPVGGSLPPGHLRPQSTIEGAIAFVVPRNGAAVTLEVPGTSRQLPLLTVDTAPAGAGQHAHDATPQPTGSSTATDHALTPDQP